MPKDITHWIVAEKTAARLGGTFLGEGARTCPNALKMGAVFPDMPLYLTGTSATARVAEAVGNEYHGIRGADTYNLLRSILTSSLQNNHPAFRAFLTGVACHLQTDITFHPLVFYLTGIYHDPDPEQRFRAMCGHRRFEVLLDLYFCDVLNQKVRNFKALDFWKNREHRDLLAWTRQDQRHPQLATMLKRAMKKYRFVQGLFTHPAAARLAGLVHPFLPDSGKAVTGLFYWDATPECRARFHEKWEYRHPVTGIADRASAHDLMARSIASSISLCMRLESAFARNDPALFTERGPSLDYGLIDREGATPGYFAQPSFFESGPCAGEV